MLSLRNLRSSAREAKKGLWADPAPVPPWEWRKGKSPVLHLSSSYFFNLFSTCDTSCPAELPSAWVSLRMTVRVGDFSPRSI